MPHSWCSLDHRSTPWAEGCPQQLMGRVPQLPWNKRVFKDKLGAMAQREKDTGQAKIADDYHGSDFRPLKFELVDFPFTPIIVTCFFPFCSTQCSSYLFVPIGWLALLAHDWHLAGNQTCISCRTGRIYRFKSIMKHALKCFWGQWLTWCNLQKKKWEVFIRSSMPDKYKSTWT